MDDEEFIEWAVAELEKQDPCPVDQFEDELAAQLGIYRHPALSLSEWRRIRVELINSIAP